AQVERAEAAVGVEGEVAPAQRALAHLHRYEVTVGIGEGRGLETLGKRDRRGAEDDIARAAIVAALVRPRSVDEQVGKTVAVHVPGGADRVAGKVAVGDAAELEAVAAVQRRERHARANAARLAEDHVARAAIRAALVRGESADEQVGKTV